MYPSLRFHRARACVCVRVVCVCGGVLHACKLRESIDIQTFYQASAFNADIGAWNTARVTDSYSVCAAFGPARTAADCARPVVDACAAVVLGGAADVSALVRAHVAMRIRVYVDGSPTDTHLCSSAIELPLHLGLPISNARTHRPFPRCMYTCIHIYASIVRARARACARACVCVCVAARCMRANYENLSIFLARVLFGCVKM
jgi:hypothetical protein